MILWFTMSNWFETIFPNEESENASVLLYKCMIDIGDIQIYTIVKSFKIMPAYEQREFKLALNNIIGINVFKDVCDAVLAASNHNSGFRLLDESDMIVSDSLRDWDIVIEKTAIFNYIDFWITSNPYSSLRNMVDYFEHDPTYLINRMNISEFLEEMIITNQIVNLPSDWMIPSELRGIIRLAKKYAVKIG